MGLKRLSIKVLYQSKIYTSENLLKFSNEINSNVAYTQLHLDLKSIEEAILTEQDRLKFFYIKTLCKPSHESLVFILLRPHTLDFISNI